MRGIVLQVENEAVSRKAKNIQLAVETRPGYETPFERTLFLDPAIRVPWGLLGAGFEFLDNWDAASPVWAYEELACDLARGDDLKRTEALIGDLRVPVYAHELLFVRKNARGKALLAAWQEEMADGGEPRLAFLRAMYRVKPLFLALPRSWLSTTQEARIKGRQVAASVVVKTRHKAHQTGTLSRVEVAPGRWVKCVPGDEERVKAEWTFRRMSRRERSGR